MATLPRAVQKQVEAAEALLGSINQPTEPQVDLVDLAKPTEPQPSQPSATAEPTAQEPVTAVQPAPAPQPSPSEDTWEKKYKSLQGMYNAEVPRLHQAKRELSDQLREALERIQRLETAQQSAQPAQPAQEPLSDPRDADTFGADLVEMVTRVVGKAIGGVVQKVESSVAKFDERLRLVEQNLTGTTQVVTETAEQRFFDRLGQLVPNWEAQNDDVGFRAWLMEPDPVYGIPRQDALTAAQRQFDAQRVATIFKAYQPVTEPAPAAPSVDSQVTPRGRTAPATTPVEKPVLTQAQITKFYRDVQSGLYRGRDAERVQVESLINEAIADGRVR